MFFPLLGTVLRDEQDPFRIVANVAVPRGKADFPVFRSGAAWWMWDGKREWMAQPGERGTPRALASLWNDTLLIERVGANWSPSEDGPDSGRALNPLPLERRVRLEGCRLRHAPGPRSRGAPFMPQKRSNRAGRTVRIGHLDRRRALAETLPVTASGLGS